MTNPYEPPRETDIPASPAATPPAPAKANPTIRAVPIAFALGSAASSLALGFGTTVLLMENVARDAFGETNLQVALAFLVVQAATWGGLAEMAMARGAGGLSIAPIASVASALAKIMWFSISATEGSRPSAVVRGSIWACVLLDVLMVLSFSGVLLRARESEQRRLERAAMKLGTTAATTGTVESSETVAAAVKPQGASEVTGVLETPEDAKASATLVADAWAWLAMLGVLGAALSPGLAARGACAALGVLGGYLAFRAEGGARSLGRLVTSAHGIATLVVGMVIGWFVAGERAQLLDPGFLAVSRLEGARHCYVQRANPAEEGGLAMWEIRCSEKPRIVGWDGARQRVIDGEELRSRRGH